MTENQNKTDEFKYSIKNRGSIASIGNSGTQGNVAVEVKGDQIGTQNNYGNPENLAETAAEIQQLLEQLAGIYPTTTLVQQAVVAEKAIEEIEKNPSLKQRTIAALKAATIEGFVELIDNPVINVMRSDLEAWREG